MGGRHAESADRQRRSKKSKLRRLVDRTTAIAVLLLIAAVPAVVVIGGSVLVHYDGRHPTTVNCITTTAEPRRGKYSGLSILVRTEDCGSLSLSPVDREEVEGIIRDVEHAEVRFSIGEGSLNLLSAFRAAGLWPTVTDYAVLRRMQ